ncbi:V-set domain containing T-cell activation inhibitor 1-like [Tachypleus tridentatus]|uniref:V-set domain containing T-cell activation inhibitor 1-like n=1 Tax=Tachypleus tridentatus TaxID=6853 RepID=UPI003FD647E7
MPFKMKKRLFAWFSVTFLLIISPNVSGVGVSKVHLLSDSNKTEYILHGEGATITCHYILDPTENVTAIHWMKDGEEVYVWRLGQKPLSKGVLKGRVNENTLSTSTIEVKEAHMDMHGTYTCKVITNKGTAQNEKYIMIIVDYNDYHIIVDRGTQVLEDSVI